MHGTQPLELTTVYVGSHASVAVLEGLLAAEGIPTFVPDRMTKTADPFITGYAPLELMLQVPNHHEAEARALVAQNSPPVQATAPVRVAWRFIALLMLLPMVIAAGLELFDYLAR